MSKLIINFLIAFSLGLCIICLGSVNSEWISEASATVNSINIK